MDVGGASRTSLWHPLMSFSTHISSWFIIFLLNSSFDINFHHFGTKNLVTDGPTDQPTDRPTDTPSHRDGWTHLKSVTHPRHFAVMKKLTSGFSTNPLPTLINRCPTRRSSDANYHKETRFWATAFPHKDQRPSHWGFFTFSLPSL